ncbi:MAG TPA: cation transporter [Elusimicrobiales bacterium]|nr:cation transporter [Elusimicrobiales bacterium]
MKTTIKVSGMNCGHCSAAVQKAAGGVPGVIAALVSLEKGEVELDYDGAPGTLEAVKKALGRAGYKAG